ncbi:MAG: carbon storage regulator [Deltaproteobacteria bacterium]|nr:carbon storage regulator [Deltaproteobacteria bacterium]
MLVLSRKRGQSIVVGNDIIITVKEIRGKNVRLSIQTPDKVPVYREEIHREIVEENRRAALAAAEIDERLTSPDLLLESESTEKEEP